MNPILRKPVSYFLRLLLIVGYLSLMSAARAQTWTSIRDGNWNDPGTWDRNTVPPANLTSGKHVYIVNTVTLNSSFASTLSIAANASINIYEGSFVVGTGISMDNRGRFTGYNGSLLQCLYVSCGNSGSQASGVWNTIDGGYTRMEYMTIQIAQDWNLNNGGKRFMKDCCVKTGQNFSINHEQNRDTLINSRFVIGLHGSGNFQQNKGNVIYDNIHIDVAGTGGGNVQFNGGSFSGFISTINIREYNGNIQTSSSMGGTISLTYYCLHNPANWQDPANKIQNETRDCNMVAAILQPACISSAPAQQPGEDRRLAGTINSSSTNKSGETIAERMPEPYTDQVLTSNRAFPNPFTGQVELEYQLDKAALVTVTMVDFTGREVYRARHNHGQGFNRMVIHNTQTLQPGFYMVSVSTSEGVVMSRKMVKK